MSDDSGDSEAQTSSTANLAEGEGDGKQGSKKKLIRLLTVMAYVSSVSGTAFMLSMYYLFLWEPKVAEHHLKGDAMGHQALALKGHVDHGQRGMYDGIYDGYPLPGVMYRPPVGSSSPGSYRSAATPMGPPMGPPLGTPGRPVSRYDYQYQDSVPMWVHSSYAQQPPHPPSLSQVREPSDPLFMTKLTTLARSPRAHPSTPPPQPTLATTSSPARNSATQVVMIRTTTASPQTNIALADIRPSSPWTLTPSAAPQASSSPEPPIVLTTERVSAPTSTSTVTSTPASAATSAPTSTLVTTPLPRRAPPNLTARKQPPILPPRSATASPWVARLPPVVQETTPAHPPVTKSPRKVVDAKKTPPLLSPGAPATKVQPPAALAAPAAVPTALLLSAKHTVMAAAREASLVLSHQDAPRV